MSFKSMSDYNREKYSGELKQKSLKSKKTKRHSDKQNFRNVEDYDEYDYNYFEKM
jgi:hypothetical protein